MTDTQSAPIGEQELIALAERFDRSQNTYYLRVDERPIVASALRELAALRAAASPRLAGREEIHGAIEFGSWSVSGPTTEAEYKAVEEMMREARADYDRQRPAPSESVAVPDGYVLVPQKALDWLNGAGPDDNGKWFGEVADEVEELDKPRRFKRTYWWRTYFRQMIDASKLSSQTSQTAEKTGGAE